MSQLDDMAEVTRTALEDAQPGARFAIAMLAVGMTGAAGYEKEDVLWFTGRANITELLGESSADRLKNYIENNF